MLVYRLKKGSIAKAADFLKFSGRGRVYHGVLGKEGGGGITFDHGDRKSQSNKLNKGTNFPLFILLF